MDNVKAKEVLCSKMEQFTKVVGRIINSMVLGILNMQMEMNMMDNG
jgi:hypothetical protein